MKAIALQSAAFALALAPAYISAPASAQQPEPSGAPPMNCPWVEGVWGVDGTNMIIAVDQDGCTFTARAAGVNANVNMQAFWNGRSWVFATTSTARDGCVSSSWGRVQPGSGRLTLTTVAADGLCGSKTPEPATVVFVPRT